MAEKSYKDAKSTFQELVQENSKAPPLYMVVLEEGPDHAKKFTVAVSVNGSSWGQGSGRSKQEAEQQAASSALEKWHEKNKT